MSSIAKNLQYVQHQIAAGAERAGRAPSSIQLLAVSKTFGAEAVREAVLAGQQAFGENYLQEALEKIGAMKALAPDERLQWHFIGPLQSNKTRPVAEHFDWVHSVEREKIARRLSEQRPPELGPLNICLQVNISGEASKSGLSPQELPQVAAQVAQLPNIRLRGLMAIPEPTDDVARQHAAFAAVHTLYQALRADGLALDTLSMGMSSDLEAAVAEGATIVRIGSAIFGARGAA
ncbi:YggS family pyridoxal phosphate-dependent enzyme [Herbaspirillum sp. WKF16]|uniref:YggS family pyridoxal phosphate-dependent enzyme n=1 Tax=Herbaspirillum sp. WKF16 TaxID=3028312 RepID=UPI0023AA0E69|nr:YggS family pyridoxal phosphate-dependent enzyme [Herbaspirillum sp. WKF16]WDZ95328.1 YggS family pyridoxal phosphate-dependent enzyme [Herbaspirillum sp. WKF16]